MSNEPTARTDDAPPNSDRSEPRSGSRSRQNDEIGIRAAAAASRKALFFVELMRGTEHSSVTPTGASRPAGLRERFENIDYVKGVAARLHLEGDEEHCRQQIARIVTTVPAVSVESRLQREWRAIEALVTPQASPRPTPRELDLAFTHFVRAAVPTYYRWLDNVITLAQRNLATIIGIAGLCLVLFGVEQTRSLFFDQWRCSFGALCILLPVPVLVLVGVLARKKQGHKGPLLRSWASTKLFWCVGARHPLGYDVFSSSSGIGRQLMFGALTKAAGFLTWLFLCAVVLGAIYRDERIVQTITWIVCLFGVFCTLFALLDFWEFLEPAPVRLLFLSMSLGMATVYAATDFSWWTVAAVCTIAFGYIGVVLWRRSHGWVSLAGVMIVVAMLGTGAMWNAEDTEQKATWHLPSIAVTTASLSAHTAALAAPIRAEQSTPGALKWPHGGAQDSPVVVLAASGGGSRAAVLTAFTLQRLSQICVRPLADGAASKHCETMADHLQAISSVSGGSLATAAYLAARLDRKPGDDVRVDDLDDKVADDFLQPVLRGALTPGVDRGKSLEQYWIDKLGLHYKLSEIAERWRNASPAAHPAVPLPIFNSATLDAHAVVLTPLDWRDCVDESDLPPEAGQSEYDKRSDPTWIYYRHAIYSLDDLLPGFDPSLAQAVHASANFPFGFPLVQVETTRRLAFNLADVDRKDGDKPRVRLTDGGVVSNSGLWTLYKLLDKHHAELQQRGVILVMVDGSKMPVYAGRTRTWDLLDAIADQPPIAAYLHSLMIKSLWEKLRGRLAVAVVGLEPVIGNNVYTSWALDRRALENLEGNSRDSLDRMEASVTAAWSQLRDRQQSIPKWSGRLPVD